MSTQGRLDAVKTHVHELLKKRLDARLVYHSIAHTFNDVLPASERLAHAEQIDAQSVELLQTAAILHDIGFINCRDGHEDAGIEIAREMLPQFGYQIREIALIAGMIRATKIPQTPHTHLEQIVADADLDVLSRPDFPTRNLALRDELAAFGTVMSDEAWYTGQLNFVRSHSYFTAAAKKRALQKQKNVQWLLDQLAAVKAAS